MSQVLGQGCTVWQRGEGSGHSAELDGISRRAPPEECRANKQNAPTILPDRLPRSVSIDGCIIPMYYTEATDSIRTVDWALQVRGFHQ
jgi:hypothetical protein